MPDAACASAWGLSRARQHIAVVEEELLALCDGLGHLEIQDVDRIAEIKRRAIRLADAVLAASSTSEMLYRSQWSRSGLSECIHVTVDGHHLMPV